MTIRHATPYLILHGRARRAISLYGEALGAKTEAVQRFGDVDASCPEAQKDLVMHAQLRIGDAMLMLSDGPGESPSEGGGSVCIALDFTDEAEARRAFDALANGGEVVEPLFDAPWGALFGVVQDALGIRWMFNCVKTG